MPDTASYEHASSGPSPRNLANALMGILLIVVSSGYLMLVQNRQEDKEAVLAEISQSVSSLEADLKSVEGANGRILPSVSLLAVLKRSPKTAVVAQHGDVALVPDIRKHNDATWLGGCKVDTANWVVIRTDYAILTQVPQDWQTPVVHTCLDRNGPQGPNLEGYDVIHLSWSRVGRPHITLLPVKQAPQ